MRRHAVRVAVTAGMALVALVAIAAASGCAGRTRPAPAAPPPPPKRDTFVYRPLVVRSASEIAPKKAPETRPLVQPPLAPALPAHDVAWEVAGLPRPWRWIVVHHSASRRGSAAVIDDWHRNGKHWDELGYHFVIGNGSCSGDGQIEVGSRWPKQKYGAHCRVGDDETYNNYGIGICLVGDFEKTRPSPEQMDALARLIDYLATRYQIDDAHVVGHRDVDSTKCPGRYFPFQDLQARLRALRAARGALTRAP